MKYKLMKTFSLYVDVSIKRETPLIRGEGQIKNMSGSCDMPQKVGRVGFYAHLTLYV